MEFYRLCSASLLVIVLLFSTNTICQYAETIRSGRPGESIGPFVVGTKQFQSQTGYSANGFNFKETNSTINHQSLGTVLRYGLHERFEVGANFAYSGYEFIHSNDTIRNSGPGNLGLAFRANIINQHEWLPSIGVQLQTAFPIDPNVPVFSTSSRMTVMAAKSLTSNLTALINLGANFSEDKPATLSQNNFFYTLNLGYAITPKWSTFIEHYASLNKSFYAGNYDLGFAFLLRNNLQLDIYGGLRPIYKGYQYAFSTGLSWRIGKKQ
jgi:hypothetical protein